MNNIHAIIISTCISIAALTASAQNVTTLRKFTNDSDGANPAGELTINGNALYGTTKHGGTAGDPYGNGTVFKINTTGSGYVKLYSFHPGTGNYPSLTNSDGANMHSGLVLAGETLYGTAYTGGVNGNGTIFSIKTNGSAFTVLHTFSPFVSGTNSDGANPYASLIVSGNTLYGTARTGGASGEGTIFKLNTNGSGYTVLHSFISITLPINSNVGGAQPITSLTLSGNTLFGTAAAGGHSGGGTIFRINTDGTAFTTLYNCVKSNGAAPNEVVLSGNLLYGTAALGGRHNAGTAFRLNADGTGFTNLHHFAVLSGLPSTNEDGAYPQGRLVLSGNTLFGLANYGAKYSGGCVFSLNINGGITNLYDFFPQFGDGVQPECGLVMAGNSLYGTTTIGGIPPGNGSVFRVNIPPPPPPPRLTITPVGSNVTMTWPTNQPGFILQSRSSIVSMDNWLRVFPDPTIINGSNTVTVPRTGLRNFYRLSK